MIFKYGNFDAIISGGQGGGGVTPEDVDAKIEEAMTAVDSKYDDTKIFGSRDDFPATGAADVLYVAQDSGYQYIWNGSDYEAIQEALTETEIRNIVQ